MRPVRRQKMIRLVLCLSMLAVIAGLVLYALRQNISLFYTPSQLMNGEAPHDRMIRLGGMVLKGSVVRDQQLNVRFQITDYAKAVTVVYQGILPDLFREEKGIVAQGVFLKNNQFRASTVLAKHDENYMPAEVRDALKQQNQRTKAIDERVP